jgi:hypothetical protein
MNLNELFLKEGPQTVSFCWGRFQPPHRAHGELFNKLKEVGTYDYWICASQSTGPKDPLDYATKMKFIRLQHPKLAQHVLEDTSIKQVFDAVTAIYNKYDPKTAESLTLVFVGDKTRVGQFVPSFQKYNGVQGKHGYYKFGMITGATTSRDVDSDADAGITDPNQDMSQINPDNISGSLVRNLAATNQFEKFATTVSKTGTESWVKDLYAALGGGAPKQSVAEGSLEEIDRRGFLKGMGAAAVAGAAGGATKANAQQVSQWVKYATDLATKSMGRISRQTGYDLRNWLVVNVSNWVTDYCTKTNSYNAKEVIDYCNQQGLEASGLDKEHALVTAFLTNMKDRYQDFLSAYRAAISDKIQEFNQVVQSQKQEKSAMGELSKEEFSILADALLLYAVSKEDNHPVHPQVSALLGKFIKARNNKDYVNSIYGKVNQSLAQTRPNAQLYADEKAKFYKAANNTLANMNKIIADAEPEFKESVNQGVAEGYQLDEGAIETITALVKKIPGIGKYYQMAQQYKPQLIEILKTSKSGKEVKQKMEQLAAGQSATVAESGMTKQLGGLAVGGGSILSTMWMNAMGLIDGVLAHAAAGEVGGAVASGSILGLIPVTLMLFAAMLLFKGSKQGSDEKAQTFQTQRSQQGMAEGTSIESTLRAVINDIGEPVTNVYDTMKFQAKKYMENHGELDRGFRMVAAGIGGRWVQSMYVGRLQNELYDLCKYNTRRTVELQQFLRGIETDGELEMKRSFGSISNELPRILAKLGQHLDAPQLTKNANRWMQNKAAYEEYIANLELEDDYDEPAVAKSPKNPAIGQQRSQIEDIVNDVLSKLPKKIAGDIRNAIARSPNKLQALQAELQKHGQKSVAEATFKKSPYGRTAASQQRARELLNPPKPPEPKKDEKKEGVAVEPDPTGYQKDLLTTPKNSLVIDTPGDLDWYKLGQHYPSLGTDDPHEYGQSDSDMMIVPFSRQELDVLKQRLDRLKMRYKEIGGGREQPEIHDRVEENNLQEHKKGVKAMKYTVKARNPVAKNAMSTIGGGGAGAHNDKKKASKQGDHKHKKQLVDLGESWNIEMSKVVSKLWK